MGSTPITQQPEMQLTDAAPPLAAGLPFIGSMFALANDSQEFIFQQYQKLGGLFRVRALGNEFKVLGGPELNILMATQPDLFTAWDIWEPLVKDFDGRRTLTMVDGPDHTRMRKLMRNSFSRFALMANVPSIVEVVQSSLKRFEVGAAIPVVPMMQRMTADELGLLSNGQTPGENFSAIVFWWSSLIEVYLSRRRSENSLQRPEYLEARQKVKTFARSIIMERQANRVDSDEDNFIDNLVRVSNEDPEFLSNDEALFLVMSPYFAGLDTVANVSSFMIYELLKHPAILGKARAEADGIFANGMPNEEAFKNMETIHHAAMETLRLFPIAGAIPRKAAKDFTFAGYPVRKGEFFLAATSASHFSPKFFPNPDQFDVERYSEPRNEHKGRGVYAPFGAGPHTCLGAGLAEVQIMLTIATLLHSVDFVLDPPNYRLKRAYTPSLSPKGLSIKITGWRV